MNAKKVKEIALETGADIVGIVSLDRFKDLQPDGNPLSIMPNAKSVIVLGHMILRGSYRGIETGSCWNTYGMGNPFSVMVEDTYNFCRRLESAGWETVPMNHQNKDLRNQGVQVSPNKPAPDVIVDMEYLAYAAGLGQMGRGKLFLTPEFGPRQVFTAVITTLELEGDTIFKGDLCAGCDACIKACPARAYEEGKMNTETFPAGKLSWNAVHFESCAICKTGATPSPYNTRSEMNRTGAACGRACIAHLEQSGKLKNALSTSFRTV